LRSDPIDFNASIPFYDSRGEVIDTYRLELVPGEAVRLVWQGQNSDPWSKFGLPIAGLFAAAAIAWAGIRLVRRMRGITAKPA
jgi:hypothetical protein